MHGEPGFFYRLMYDLHFPFHERHEKQKTTHSKEENRDIIILRRNVRI